MPHRRYTYTPSKHYTSSLPIIFEHASTDTMVRNSSSYVRIPSPKRKPKPSKVTMPSSTTKTSQARAVRSNATSWAQDDEDEEHEWLLIEKPEKKSCTCGGVGWWKKAVKKISDLKGGKGEDDEGKKKKKVTKKVKVGDEDRFSDVYAVGESDEEREEPVKGSAGRGLREQY